MDPSVYFALVAATAVMISLPGPSVLLTVANSITHSWRGGIITVAGATAGVAVQLTIAAIGLASLLQSAATVFEWIRWAGAAYLIYLGVRQWRSAGAPIEANTPKATTSNLFVQGLAITVPNPKSLIFIAAFLPQFIDPSISIGIQLAVIVPTFLVITFVVTSIWALAADRASVYLKSQRATQNMLRGAGGLMVVAGLGLAFARRTS